MNALRKILVVDDDPVVGKSFDRVLSDKGYIVVTAENGAEALNKLRDEEYDAVFTDIRMPGMDGLEVAEKVKARRPWTPVVIVTGYGTEANEEMARAAGVCEFLRKPLSPEMIEESALKAVAAMAPAAEAPVAAPVQTLEALEEPRGKWAGLKDTVLFLAAPLIGLAYAVLLPFIGLAMLAWMIGKEAMKIRALRKALTGVRNVGLFIAAPFIGLAYVVAGPFVGIAVLAWQGGKSLIKRNIDS